MLKDLTENGTEEVDRFFKIFKNYEKRERSEKFALNVM